MPKYVCPDFNNGESIYRILTDFQKYSPEFLKEDAEIKSIYGNATNCIWNGGGCSLGTFVPLERLYYLAQLYSNLHIPIRLTFTNPLLEKDDMKDRYANKVASIFHSAENYVIVSSEIMENHIREHYPKYKIVRSIVNTREDYNFIEALDKYDEIVLPRRHVKDFDFLETIPKEKRERVELLCNDPCPIDCPRLYDHYEEKARQQLYEEPFFYTCNLNPDNDLPSVIKRFSRYQDQQILPDEIYAKYLPMGYNNFKLSGRGNPHDVMHSIAKYFIKEEYLYDFVCVVGGGL